MIAFRNTIVIHKSVEDTFAFLSDFTNIPKWNYYVYRVTPVSSGETAAGTVFRQERRQDEQIYEIIDFEPPERLGVKTLPGSSLQFERTFVLCPSESKTELRDDWKIHTGRSGFVEKLASRKIKNAVRENLGKLKELLETGRTMLQDGREVSL
jgi:uncharacterized membrane protein